MGENDRDEVYHVRLLKSCECVRRPNRVESEANQTEAS